MEGCDLRAGRVGPISVLERGVPPSQFQACLARCRDVVTFNLEFVNDAPVPRLPVQSRLGFNYR